MRKIKLLAAFFLSAVMILVSGSDSIRADTFFSQLFRGASKSSDLVVVLDAGHGGSDSGAVGNRLMEKILTLKIAQYCKAELEQYNGVKVYMTRKNDTFVGLDQRISIASGVKADVFVSLHINSAVSSSATGAEVFYPNSNYRPALSVQGKRLASAIQKNLTSLGLRNRGLKTANSMIGSSYPDGSLADYYAVIRGAKKAGFPGIIVEHAFISNASDAKTFLNTNSQLKKLGVADAKGIAACYGLKKTQEDSGVLKKTSLTKAVGSSSTSVTLQWKKVSGAGGYEIFLSSSKNGEYRQIATVKKSSSVTYKDKSVKGGKTYYYKVRPYRVVSGVKETADLSVAQSVKTLKKPVVQVKKKSSTRANVSWKEVKGAVKYEVYRSTAKNGKYKKIASVQELTSYRDMNRKAGRAYFYKVRAVSNGLKGSTVSSYSSAK